MEELTWIQLSIQMVQQKKGIQYTEQKTEFYCIVEKGGSMVGEELSTGSCKAIIDMYLSMKEMYYARLES